MTLTDRIAARLGALDFDGLASLYRPDALLDVSVPQWRFQLQGRQAIREALAEEAGHLTEGARVTGQRATRTDDGVVIELEVRFVQEGEERQWREVHLFHTDGTAITEHVNYCTGIWDAATIARQAVEAPMVRR
ncbi:MAG: nuclear transport factor 2 family protein [Acidimicrobiales bacterium]